MKNRIRLRSKQAGNIISLLVMIIAVAVAAFGVVASVYFSQPKVKTNTNIVNTNSGASSQVPAPGHENVNEAVVINANAATNTNSSSVVLKDWQTYSNTALGFSIQYPNEYTLSKLDDGVKLEQVIPAPPTNYLGGKTYQVLVRRLTGKEKNTNDQEIYAWAIRKFAAPVPAGYLDQRTVKLGENSTTAFTVASGIDTVTDYFAIQGSNVYWLHDSRLGTGGETNMKILDTFKLLDPTADWQTYTNTVYGFTLKYPNDLHVTQEQKGTDSLSLTFDDGSAKKPYTRALQVWINADGYGGVSGFTSFTLQRNGTGFDIVKTERDTTDERYIYLAQEPKSNIKDRFQFSWWDGTRNSPDSEQLLRLIISTFTFTQPHF